MAYCKKCGVEIADNAQFCPKCGASQVTSDPGKEQESQTGFSSQTESVPPNTYTVNVYNQRPDNGGFGWGLLGCCIPIVGLILFLVWRDTRPRTAKAVGIGALVNVGIWAVYFLLILLFGVGSVFL